jgi:hypothetical protein
MRKQIFLDCDGVLADFDKGAEDVLGMHPRVFEKRFNPGLFWKRLATTPDFFANLEPMADAFELYEAGRRGDHDPGGAEARTLPSGRRARR